MSNTRPTMQSKAFNRMKRRFFFRTVCWFVLPMIIPLILIGFTAILVLQTYVKTEIDHRNEQQLTSNAVTMDSLISELGRLSLTLSSNPSVRMKLKNVILKLDTFNGIQAEDYDMVNTIIDLLYSSVDNNPNIASLYVYFNNDNGWFISSTNRFSNLDFYFDAEWVKEYQSHLKETNQYWFQFRTIPDYLFEKGNNLNVLTLYQKIYSSGKQEPDGVLVLNVREDRLDDTMKGLLHAKDQKLLLLDKKGTVLLQSSDGNFSAPSSLSQFTANAFYCIYQVDSTLYDWSYASVIPKEQAYAVPNRLTEIIILICVLAGIGGFLVAWSLAVKDFDQIMELVSVIQLATTGKPIPEVKHAHNDLFHYVMQNVIRSFITINYLEVQLSERRYHAKMLELLALQSQLNPHFMYNTMQTIQWKAIGLTGKPNDVSNMIEQLSDILHYALDSKDNMSELSEEIRITKAYISIQQIRHEHKFSVMWDFSDIDLLAKVPKLLIQPLVENSLQHGIRDKEGFLAVRISFTNSNDRFLRIRVIDNGKGIDRQSLRILRKQLYRDTSEIGEHVGLGNTAKRLRLLYGDKAALFIHSAKGHGTVITIKIPFSLPQLYQGPQVFPRRTGDKGQAPLEE